MNEERGGGVPFLVMSFPQLGGVPVIGIIRGCPPARVVEVGRAGAEAGIGVLEVTFDSDEPGEQVERLREALPDVVVGAGTILEFDDLDEAADRGAAFIVTPVVDEDLIGASIERALPCVAGAASPTEVWDAYQWGAVAVKVFPAEQLGGPAYLRALQGPLGGIDLIPTGGVDAGNARAYLDAGAVALGVGSTVFEREAMENGDVGAVWRKAVEIVTAARRSP